MSKKYNKKTSSLKQILAGIFSFCYVIGASYQEIGSFGLIFNSPTLILISLVQLFCYYYLIKTVFCFLDTFLERNFGKTR